MQITDRCYFVLDTLHDFIGYAKDNYLQSGVDADLFRQIAFWLYQFVTKCGGFTQ